MRILTAFATNLTRYYYLEVLATGREGRLCDDPIASWYHEVTSPVLDLHYSKRLAERDGLRAAVIDQAMGASTFIRGVTETGETIDTIAEDMLRSLQAEAARPWERMYVMQIARFLGEMNSEFADLAHGQRLPVHFLREFFYIFAQDDSYFRSRKTWSLD